MNRITFKKISNGRIRVGLSNYKPYKIGELPHKWWEKDHIQANSKGLIYINETN